MVECVQGQVPGELVNVRVIHTWTWNVRGYPGTWFVFAKSIHYFFRGKSAFFYKRWQKRLGMDPVSSGWND
jgi:hypothetical protein